MAVGRQFILERTIMLVMSPASNPVVLDFLNRITPLRKRLEKVILFGSRARGDDKPFSDFDVLIVVPHKDRELKSVLYDAAVDTLLCTGREISLKVISRADFDRQASLPTPFMERILREGIPLG
jgi:predicted nucleotidyltransferase